MEKVAIRNDSGIDAIERLFREEGRSLWRALVAFTGGRREIADDAAAEAFAQALRYSASIRDEKAWLYRTAFRIAARELRREKRHAGADRDPPTIELHHDQEVLPTLRHLSRNQRAAIVSSTTTWGSRSARSPTC